MSESKDEKSKPNLLEMSPDEARKLGQHYASFAVGFRGEISNAGFKENQIRELLRDMMSLGECSDGVMCIVYT